MTGRWTGTAQRILDSATVVLGWLGSTLLFGMMAAVTVDVISRLFFRKPFAGSLEITETLLTFVVFSALALTHIRGGHVRVHILTIRLSPRVRSLLDAFAHLFGATFFTMLAWQAWRSAKSALEHGETTLGAIEIPLFPAKFFLVIGSLLLVLQMVRSAFVLGSQLLHHRKEGGTKWSQPSLR